MFTCQATSATNNREKNLKGLKQKLEVLETAPIITRAIIGGLREVHKGGNPSAYSCGTGSFDGGITISGIIRDQADIGWINFLCGRFSIQWKEAQKRHYLRIGSKKSPRLWAIAILEKLLMIRWDMWQFRNKVLHSPTGPTAIASHHSLNHQISEEHRRGTDGIDRSSYHLFSTQYSITDLQSSTIDDKQLWLKSVTLARKEYDEPDSEIVRQAISMRTQMQAFLTTDGPFLPVPPRDRPIATQEHRISVEDQQAASVRHFGIELRPKKRARVTSTVTDTENYQQRTLFNSW